MTAEVITNHRLMAHMLAVRYADLMQNSGQEAAIEFANKYVTKANWNLFCEYAEEELVSRGYEVP